jgi:ATP-dependent helicase/nuclease subunit B
LGELHDASVNQPGIKPSDDWQLQLNQWQQQLQKLADDFIAGDARVDFKDKILESYATDLIPLTRLADADALAQFTGEANHP